MNSPASGEIGGGDVRVVAVTGADGFIGERVCSELEARQLRVVRIVRKREGRGSDRRVVDLESAGDLTEALRGADVVVHLAGRAHVLRETEADPQAAFQRINVDMSLRLAQAAAAAALKRFVYVSSIGVNGNSTAGTAFSEGDEPAPVEPYAASKLRAESALREFCKSARLQLVIVRPPLVYGPHAKGNFARLVKIACSGLPLPIGSIRNRRNLVGAGNLADFLVLCAIHPAAAGEVFLVAEREAHSTPELIEALARALGMRSRIFRFPVGLLKLGATILGRRGEFEKLCGSLEVSASKAHRVLGWSPRHTFDAEIARIADADRQAHRSSR